MFSLHEQEAMLVNVNVRVEQHGEEKKLAADLKVSMKLPNTFLDNFDPELKSAFFKKADADQADMVSDNDPNHLPSLRFPQLSPYQGLKEEGAGYRATIHSLLGKTDTDLTQLGIDKVRFETQEGGTILFSFRMVAHPTEKEVGSLCSAIQQPITLSLTPPSPEEQAQMELQQHAA